MGGNQGKLFIVPSLCPSHRSTELSSDPSTGSGCSAVHGERVEPSRRRLTTKSREGLFLIHVVAECLIKRTGISNKLEKRCFMESTLSIKKRCFACTQHDKGEGFSMTVF